MEAVRHRRPGSIRLLLGGVTVVRERVCVRAKVTARVRCDLLASFQKQERLPPEQQILCMLTDSVGGRTSVLASSLLSRHSDADRLWCWFSSPYSRMSQTLTRMAFSLLLTPLLLTRPPLICLTAEVSRQVCTATPATNCLQLGLWPA